MIEGGRAQVDKGITLYHVLASDYANGTEDDWREIGQIVTETFFKPSLWGDEKLFFKHGSLQDDLSFAPAGWEEDSRFAEVKDEYAFNR